MWGATHIKDVLDVRLFTPLAGGVCSPQGLGRASNPRVIEAKTFDPLRHMWVTPIMTSTIPTMVQGE
jgi:hypothetical protein